MTSMSTIVRYSGNDRDNSSDLVGCLAVPDPETILMMTDDD